MNLSLITKTLFCKYCNQPKKSCRCPGKQENKVIEDITQQDLRFNKTITIVKGSLPYNTFYEIKTKLGTGGVFEQNFSKFRGAFKKKIQRFLKEKGYLLRNECGP